ncbi:MAG TPA: helix-turn-helix domain-containing protein, partial [Candidatus Parabacteroides faecavium]|nr:helix-turn-helix domain-containing protein [Candidatus Parabacteroides faecavium]
MKESNYEQEKSRRNLEREIFRLVKQDNVSIQEVVQQYGVSRSSIYRIIATFERENPLEAELMKKQGKDV